MQKPNDAPGTARFVPLHAGGAVASLFERSHHEPVILFQHDPYCPISNRAHRELTRVPIEVALVDVARDADVSRKLEERTGIRHQSPQLLVLRSGRVVWSASHFAITRGAVTQAVRDAALVQSVDQPDVVRSAACGYGGTALKEQSLESPRLATRLRSAWDCQ